MTLHCRECGEPYQRRGKPSLFCSEACRRTFNNRRAQRGAAVYDLAMEWRFARDIATKRKTFTLFCTMLGRFNDEDKRDARRSWSPSVRMTNINSRIGR